MALEQCIPSLELIVAGSCCACLPTYPEWDRVVLEHTYEFVDHISLHIYANDDGLTELGDYLAVDLRLDTMMRTISATCDYVKALNLGKKDITLAIDAWHVLHWKNMHPPRLQAMGSRPCPS